MRLWGKMDLLDVEDVDWLRGALPDLLSIATFVAGYAEDGVDGACIGCRAKPKAGEAHTAGCVWRKAKQVVASAGRTKQK